MVGAEGPKNAKPAKNLNVVQQPTAGDTEASAMPEPSPACGPQETAKIGPENLHVPSDTNPESHGTTSEVNRIMGSMIGSGGPSDILSSLGSELVNFVAN